MSGYLPIHGICILENAKKEELDPVRKLCWNNQCSFFVNSPSLPILFTFISPGHLHFSSRVVALQHQAHTAVSWQMCTLWAVVGVQLIYSIRVFFMSRSLLTRKIAFAEQWDSEHVCQIRSLCSVLKKAFLLILLKGDFIFIPGAVRGY